MDVNSFGILSMQIAWKVMISCVITTVKENEYQRKRYFLRINFIIIKDVGMDITTNKLNCRHRYTTPWRIHHTILLLSWQTTKPYGYFCTFKTDIAIPLPRLLITACNAKPIIFISVTDVTIRLPVLSMTSYHNCTQFALIGDTLTDISSLIHVWPSW